jgi:hypothetical protein
MASIPYPIINGVRHDFTSTVLKIDEQEFQGYRKVTHNRKRDRTKVYGNNPDPLGKTRGKNDYEFKVTVLLAEFKAFITDYFESGYGDAVFSCQLSYIENGFDSQDVLAIGCTIDESSFDHSEGTDALEVEIDFSPIKIIYNGVDDNATPLVGAPAQA